MFGVRPKININAINDELKKGQAVLVDVREYDEWRTGHAAGAIHLSVNRIAAGELPTKDTNQKIYTYCASGGRSGSSAQILNKKGYEVINIGGISSWRSAGGKIEA